ncbi:MAG: winged helix-turn-helix domain-containing protein [Candidatus Nitrosopolaris sp.]
MKLMYKAYLSFNQLREYLTLLVENDLIEYEMGQTYRTIERRMRGVIAVAESNR